VGRYGNNQRRADVQLIQFFLQSFFFSHPELFGVAVPPTSNGSPIIRIDGLCGAQTIAAIKAFQNNRNVRVDGLVSVANRLTNFNGQNYTIHLLNQHFRLHGNGKQFHGHLEDHPIIMDFAPELQSELASKSVQDVLVNVSTSLAF
jgi:peptidoglycan hydrolase-like protein with peptidoglycan-binding domain